MQRQPDFIYVGVKRSASTFLRGYFDSHPDIVWRRDSFYLIDDAAYACGNFETTHDVPDTARFVEVNECLATGLMIGADSAWEKSRTNPGVSYAECGSRVDPVEIAQRTKRTFPDARIVLTIRNQVEWLRTHYRVFIGLLPPRRHRFSDFLTTLEGQLVLHGGHYHRTIEAYFDLFGRDNVHVALFEDIRDDETAMLRKLCAFLGVREAPYEARHRRYNRGPSNVDVMVKSWLAAAGVRSAHLGPLRPLARSIRERLPERLGGMDPLSQKDRRTGTAFYALSNQQTARLIGRDLAAAGYPW